MTAFAVNIWQDGAEAVTAGENALKSHLLAFADERSRVEDGRTTGGSDGQ